jgi:hypothetical protein
MILMIIVAVLSLLWMRGIVFMLGCYSAWSNVIVPFINNEKLTGTFFRFNWETFSVLTWAAMLFGFVLLLPQARGVAWLSGTSLTWCPARSRRNARYWAPNLESQESPLG